MGIGTFGAFTQARLAIYAAQTGITVTGNNISNINTPGYTRQRLNQVSLYAAGSDRYYAEGDVRVGQGALVKNISQIRNPYLDIRYREENAKVGFYDARLEGLNSISRVLDEVGLGDAGKGEDGFGVLGLNIMDLYKALQNITDQTGQQEYDDSIKGIATSLVSKLHAYANQLEQVRTDTIMDFKEDLETVNNLLDGIRALNEEIRKCEIHGDPALELRDERNRQIDELSGLIDINVVYGEEQIAAGVTVEKMSLYLGDGNPDKSVKTDESLLIDGVYSANIILGKPKMNPDYVTGKAALDKDLAAGKIDKAAYEAGLKALPDPYVKVNDDGTETLVKDIRDATILTDDADNPNYDMMITELKNKTGDPNYVGHAYTPEKVTGADLTALLADLAAGNVKFTSKSSMTSRELSGHDLPAGYEEGDKVIEIYMRTLKPGATNLNDPNSYEYTKQIYSQIVSKPVVLDDNDLYGELQAERELLTEEGVFIDQDTIPNIDENAVKKRGIGYYQKALDLLANRLANTLNEANQGFLMDPDGNYIKKDTKADGTPNLDKDGREVGVPIKVGGQALNKDWEKSAGNRDAILADVGLGTVTKEKDLTDIGLTWKQVTDAYLKGQQWQMNAAGNGGKFIPENKTQVLDSNGAQVAPGWEDQSRVDATGAIFVGAPLFSNSNDSDDVRNITASNIDISQTWSHASSLVRSFTCIPGTTEVASGQSDNLVHMKYLVGEKEIDFIPNQLDSSPNASKKVLFNGTFYQMWNDIGGTLGQDQSEATTMLDTYYQSALSIDTDRDSVSSVDFNDEAMNLMMYAKSCNAACRLMTTIDTVLDKLINNTGVTT
nr:hypothetical protein [uncultured Oscillibacter sp.]